MVRLIILLVIGLALLLTQTWAETLASVELQTRTQSRRRGTASRAQQKPARNPTRNYAAFSHATHVTKQKLTCAGCHKFPSPNWKQVRKGDDAFEDVAEFPQHAACLDCHREQFFARERPAPKICSNCHVAVTPRNTVRFLFPSLGDVTDPTRPRRDAVSEFAVNFPHETHLDVVSRNGHFPQSPFVAVSWKSQQQKQPPANCPICHQTYQPQGQSSEEYFTKPPKDLGEAFWLKKGAFKTIPNSHTKCFTCHNAESGITPVSSSCDACHKLRESPVQINSDFDPKMPAMMGVADRVVLHAWRERISAGAYRHEGGAHPDLACTDCHVPARLNTVDIKTRKVPVSSCGGAEGCHATATLDEGGILNYEIEEKKKNPSFVCTKCHLTFGKQSTPASHVSALPKPTK